jgi:hypothetical protein
LEGTSGMRMGRLLMPWSMRLQLFREKINYAETGFAIAISASSVLNCPKHRSQKRLRPIE